MKGLDILLYPLGLIVDGLSAVSVSQLLAWCGNHLNCDGAVLAPLFA